MERRYIALKDGKKVYTEIYGEGYEQTLLYLHGGPGHGSLDFQFQAGKLSEHMRVILLDQRGVLRSDRILASEAFGLEDLIDDCDDIRTAFGIARWSVLGHSFGGVLALHYATKYPKSVDKVVFNSPSFYSLGSMRSVYQKAVRIARQRGELDCAKELEEYAAAEGHDNVESLVGHWQSVPEPLRQAVYGVHEWSDEVKGANWSNQSDITEEQWENGAIHQGILIREDRISENVMPLLLQLQCPSLLLCGGDDPICYEEQNEFYLQNVPAGRLVTFENSGHSPHNEEPDRFTEVVLDFLVR